MWSLTSLRTKRMSSFRKFRLLPPKDFFDSIDPNRTLHSTLVRAKARGLFRNQASSPIFSELPPQRDQNPR